MNVAETDQINSVYLTKNNDGSVTITLNNPEINNAMSFEQWELFTVILDSLERSDPPIAIILTGAGKFFCSGGNMRVAPARGKAALASVARLEMSQRVLHRLRTFPAPVIAAIEGGANGIGWSLALVCDVIIAAETAVFSAPFIRFGLPPDGGSAWLMSRQIGQYRAADILFSGRPVSARLAENLGLVSRLVPNGTALDAARAWVAEMGAEYPHAIELTKRQLLTAQSGDLMNSLNYEKITCAVAQYGDESRIAREKFFKRK